MSSVGLMKASRFRIPRDDKSAIKIYEDGLEPFANMGAKSSVQFCRLPLKRNTHKSDGSP